MKWMDRWVAADVRRALVLGRALVLVGVALFMLGALALALPLILDVKPNFASPLFFWLPVSLVGFAVALLIAAIGLLVVVRAASVVPPLPDLPSTTEVLGQRYPS